MSKNNKKGFTIIEVVLVLAIAGLIFLMVFIALPALQRSQRNTRRRSDISRINAALVDYIANNPSSWKGDWGSGFTTGYAGQTSGISGDSYPGGNPLKLFVIKYVDSNCSTDGTAAGWNAENCSDQFRDPDGTPYRLYSKNNFANWDSDTIEMKDAMTTYYREHTLFISGGSKCSGSENEIKKADGRNEFTILYILEGGSIYCSDNQ